MYALLLIFTGPALIIIAALLPLTLDVRRGLKNWE